MAATENPGRNLGTVKWQNAIRRVPSEMAWKKIAETWRCVLR